MKNKYISCLIFLSFACISNTQLFAETVDVEHLTNQDIESMTQDKLDQLPAIQTAVVFLKNSKFSEKYNVDPSLFIIGRIEIALNNLKYYYRNPSGIMNPELTDAIKKFQQSIGHSPTGALTVEEMRILTSTESQVLPDYLSIVYGNNEKPYIAVFGTHHEYLTAQGTWDLINEKSGSPINISKIECDKMTNVCIDINANVTEIYGKVLDIQKTEYKITKWDENEIQAKADGNCRNTIMIINLKNQEIGAITSDVDNDELCSDAPKHTQPIFAKLSGSFPIYMKFIKENETKIKKSYNPEYTKAVEMVTPKN